MKTEVSPIAYRLWKLISERGGYYSLAEAKRELQASKSAILLAIDELESCGIIKVRVRDA